MMVAPLPLLRVGERRPMPTPDTRQDPTAGDDDAAGGKTRSVLPSSRVRAGAHPLRPSAERCCQPEDGSKGTVAEDFGWRCQGLWYA